MNRRLRGPIATLRSSTPSLLGAGLITTALLAGGCQRYVDVEVSLIEPCDQQNQALNGITTFQVTAAVGGGTDPVITRFTTDEAAPPLEAPIGDGTILTIEGWTANGNTDASVFNTTPQAIGRTVPLSFSTAPAEKLVLLTGRRDSLGGLPNADGTCQDLENGGGVPGRHGHTATHIIGTSLVLIAGGAVWIDGQVAGERVESLLQSAEILDTATGEMTPLPSLPNPRAYHTATALADGTVLVAGGLSLINGNLSALSNGFVFDPRRIDDGPYAAVILRQDRAHHTATYLEELGLVVIIGGCTGAGCLTDRANDVGAGDPTALLTSVEVYNVEDRTSLPADPLKEPRAMHAASSLGRQVVVSGGVSATGLVCSLEVFDASGNTVDNLDLVGGFATLNPCPARHQQVSVSEVAGNNRIALIGGFVESNGGQPNGTPTANVTFWNTAVGVESNPTSLISGRAGHRAAKLQDGTIFVYGGNYAVGGAPAEKLVLQVDGTHLAAPLTVPPVAATDNAALALLPNNQAFISGGHSPDRVTSKSAYVYFGD